MVNEVDATAHLHPSPASVVRHARKNVTDNMTPPERSPPATGVRGYQTQESELPSTILGLNSWFPSQINGIFPLYPGQ